MFPATFQVNNALRVILVAVMTRSAKVGQTLLERETIAGLPDAGIATSGWPGLLTFVGMSDYVQWRGNNT